MNRLGVQPMAAESPFPLPVSGGGIGAEASECTWESQPLSAMPTATNMANAMANKANGTHLDGLVVLAISKGQAKDYA